MALPEMVEMTDEQTCTALEATVIKRTVDIGVAYVHQGTHPDHGDVTIISTCSGSNLMIK